MVCPIFNHICLIISDYFILYMDAVYTSKALSNRNECLHAELYCTHIHTQPMHSFTAYTARMFVFHM